jgi:CheY-like chemotaxis protein
MKTTLVSNRLNAPNILLVDDNRNGLIVRKALLEEIGYVVAIASGGEEALELFLATAFDVVVTDYRMPRMNGTELIQKLRRHNPNARVILLSGFVDPLGLTEESTGADVVLSKSCNEASQLMRSVKRLLGRASARKPPAPQKNPTRGGASAKAN